MVLKTGANAQISIHADSYHHTIVIKEPSFDFFIISSCRDWWIISEMGVKTNRSQQHPEREGPISVIGAIELHIHDRGTKRDWRKYAGRRGEDPMAAAGGEGNARRRRAAGTGRGRPQPAVNSREGSGASGGGAQQQKGGEPAGGATHQGERRRLKQRRRRRGGARRGLER